MEKREKKCESRRRQKKTSHLSSETWDHHKYILCVAVVEALRYIRSLRDFGCFFFRRDIREWVKTVVVDVVIRVRMNFSSFEELPPFLFLFVHVSCAVKGTEFPFDSSLSLSLEMDPLETCKITFFLCCCVKKKTQRREKWDTQNGEENGNWRVFMSHEISREWSNSWEMREGANRTEKEEKSQTRTQPFKLIYE